MPPGQHTFHCEIEKSGSPAAGQVAKVICHGSLVNQTSNDLSNAVKLLIADGGQITLDFSDVSFVDSLGLGTLVGLKVSAIGKDQCTLQFKHLSERIQELLRLAKLTDMFES
jgi:anti-sigma B factor antagonist